MKHAADFVVSGYEKVCCFQVFIPSDMGVVVTLPDL